MAATNKKPQRFGSVDLEIRSEQQQPERVHRDVDGGDGQRTYVRERKVNYSKSDLKKKRKGSRWKKDGRNKRTNN